MLPIQGSIFFLFHNKVTQVMFMAVILTIMSPIKTLYEIFLMQRVIQALVVILTLLLAPVAESNSADDFASLASVQEIENTDQTESAKVPAALEEDPFSDIREPLRKCVKCHGETGHSTRAGRPSITANDPEYFVSSMQSYADGSRGYKMMKKLVSKLDEATIEEMAVFFSIQEPLQTEIQGMGDVSAGRRLSEGCEKCHGVDGNAQKASVPTLAGQDAKYFIKVMNHYQMGMRQHEKMSEAVEELGEQDIIDLATYFAAEQPQRRDLSEPPKNPEWIADGLTESD